jgi:hypothetical protein
MIRTSREFLNTSHENSPRDLRGLFSLCVVFRASRGALTTWRPTAVATR